MRHRAPRLLFWPAIACLMFAFKDLASAEPAGPAFDCQKASHEIETAICKDADLSALDRKLANKFAEAKKNLSNEQIDELTTEQRGWIKGRNDCWKADDKKACAAALYSRRIVTLEARYGLANVGASVYFACNDGAADELIFTPIETNPPSANLVRGNSTATVILDPAGSGSKYTGDNGVSFWSKGDAAVVEWPEGKSFDCKVKGPDGPE